MRSNGGVRRRNEGQASFGAIAVVDASRDILRRLPLDRAKWHNRSSPTRAACPPPRGGLSIIGEEMDTKRILLAGTFDAQMARFIQQTRRRPARPGANVSGDSARCDFALLSPTTVKGLEELPCVVANPVDNDSFDVAASQFDAVVWFALTPRGDASTMAGTSCDIELWSAFQMARALRRQASVTERSTPFVLVTRIFPTDARPLGNVYDHWRKLYNIFDSFVDNLRVIRVSIEISEYDAIFMALVEYATRSSEPDISRDMSWLNVSRPIGKGVLSEAIARAVDTTRCPTARKIQTYLVGDGAVSYAELLTAVRRGMGDKPALAARMRCLASQTARRRAKFFAQTRQFHTIDDLSSTCGETRCTDCLAWAARCVEDIVDELSLPARLLLDPVSKPRGDAAPFIVRRIANAPRRSLYDTTQLLMHWLPSYFKRSLNIEKVGGDVLRCKMSRVTLCEIEQKIDAPFFNRLIVYRPYMRKPLFTIALAMLPANVSDSGTLLVACHTPSDNRILSGMFARIFQAFGQFVEEYC